MLWKVREPEMKTHSIRKQIADQIDQLPTEMQQRVLGYAHALASGRPKGISGEVLAQVAGTLRKRDAAEMRRAIEEGCERIDPNGW